MATMTETKPNAQPVIQRLKSLRRKLRGWVLVDGLARVLLVVVLLAVADMLLDRVFKMDVAQRAIMLALMLATLIVVAYRRLIRPLAVSPSDDALVLEVEQKNRDRGQSLISGFQLARASNASMKGMSPSLVNASIEAANRRAQAIDFSTALNKTAAARNRVWLGAGLAACAAMVIGAMTNDFVQTWFNRNILLGSRQWPQATYLQIMGVVDGQLSVDRGADHDLKIEVTEISRDKDVSVQVEFETGTKRSNQAATATGRLDGREHQLLLRAVNSEFRMRAVGGEATTEWVDVRLVEPIDVKELRLIVELPSYVGGQQPLVGSGPHSVLTGSKLHIEVESNLAIESAQLKWNESTLGGNESTATSDGRFPMQKIDATHFHLTLPSESSATELRGGRYSIELIGERGRKNLRPIAFQITISDDKAPKIAASLSGISGLVVPRAQVPVSFKAIDRYGLATTSVEYQWKTGDDNVAPQTGVACQRALAPTDIQWSAMEQEFSYAGSEAFDLQPLAIQPGEVLRFTVNAQDNQPAGIGVGKSREFLLRVVTEEELRADLLRREIEQRALFQQERTNQLQLLTDLRALAASALSADVLAERQQTLIEFQNRQKNVGTNLFQVAERFAGFLEEAKNNRLDESEKAITDQIEGQSQTIVSLQTRYAQRIIEPIRNLDSTEVYLASQSLEEARGLLGEPAKFAETANQTAELQESIVRRMDQILSAMEDSQTYQEIVNQVIALKRLEQGLLDSIKTKQKKPGQLDIFDPSTPSQSDQPPQAPNKGEKNQELPKLK